MATGTAQPTPVPPPVQSTASAGFERFIVEQLDKTRSQLKLIDLFSSLLLLGAAVLGFLLVTAVVDAWLFDLGFVGRTLALLVLLGGAGYIVATRVLPLILRQINPAYAARIIEQAQPSLKNSLINFLLLRSNRVGVHDLVFQAVEEQAALDLEHVPADSAVDRSRLIKLAYVLAGVLLVCALYYVLSPKNPLQTVARVLTPWAGVSRPARVEIDEVEPGDAEVFHGHTLKVSARVNGARSSDHVLIVFSTLDGQLSERTIAMQPAADGLHCEGVLSPGDGGIQQDISYRVAVYDRRFSESQLADSSPVVETQRFRVAVRPAPTITVQSVQYVYPSYTRRPVPPPQKHGDIEAIEGTKVTITASANLPIQSAHVEFDPLPRDSAQTEKKAEAASGRQSQVLAMHTEGQEARCTFVLELAADRATPKYSSYQLRFITAEGHQNEQPIAHRIAVTRDLPPEIEILTPKDDRIEVPEDGKQTIEIRALDPDFSLTKVSLRAVSGGDDLLDKSLLSGGDVGRGQAVVNFEFKPAELSLTAGEEVVYWAVAADNRTAPRSGLPEPNTERTRNYHIKITPAVKKPDPDKKDQADGEKEPMPGENPEKKPMPKQGEGEKKNPSQNGNPGEGSKGNESDPGEQGGEKKPGEKNDGAGSKGQNKAGEGSAGGKPGDKSEDSSGNKQGADSGDNSGKPGGNDADSGSKAGSGEKGKSQPGKKPSGAGQESGDSSSEPAEGAADSTDGAPGQNNRRPGGPGGKQTEGGKPGEGSVAEKREGPLHEGEVVERINEHVKEAQSQEGKGQPGAKNEKNGEREGTNSATAEKQPGPGQTGEKRPGEEQPGDKQPAGAAGEKPQQKPEKKSGESESGAGGNPQGPAETKPEGAASGKKSEQEQPAAGEGKNGKSGAGEKSEDKSGSPASQEENKDRDKKQGEKSGGGEKQGDEAKSPSQSKKQSDSKGSEGGDKSGGGKSGGGQGANQAGNDSAGGNTPGDQGGGAAPQPGSGPTSGAAGKGPVAEKPTGVSGSEQGDGSSTDSGAGGKEPGPGEKGKPTAGKKPQGDPASNPAAQGQKPSEQGAKPGETPSTPSQEGSQPRTDGQAGDSPSNTGNAAAGGGGGPFNDPRNGPNLPGELPPEEKANLEYARKATDLALSHLRDQKDNPDPELLDKLGMTNEELQKFFEKWESLKRAAAKDEAKAKRELDESLRSLGLRPQGDKVRSGAARKDEGKGLLDQGSRSAPPPAYLEQFNAFKRGTARAEK